MQTIERDNYRFFLPDDASEQVADMLEKLPETFLSQGTVLHQGRNEVRSMTLPLLGTCVVKRFGKPNIFKRLGNLFHGSKCYRAFNNAQTMNKLGLSTPKALAGMEDKKATYHYLVTEYDNGISLLDYLTEQDPSIDLPNELAQYFYTLHQGGILHRDLNNTNIRLAKVNGHLHFSVIDINRMKICDSMPTLSERMENLFKFSEDDDFYLQVLRKYLTISGEYTDEAVDKALARKQKYDREFQSRKRILRKIKGWFKLNRS